MSEGIPLVNAVTLTAPSDLEGGFVLDASIGATPVKVRVPDGGVKEGQEFKAEIVQGLDDIPYGAWRDGLFDCCKHGACHKHLCLGWCFPLCLVGQVANRVGLFTSLANGTFGVSTFRMFFIALVSFYVTGAIESMIEGSYAVSEDDPNIQVDIPFLPLAVLSVCQLLQWLIAIGGFVATVMTRYHIREMYNIPNSLPAEDLICVCCCSPCTVCQMARHTTNYYLEDAKCCTDTGLGPTEGSTTIIV